MTAMTAGAVLKQLSLRRRQSDIARIADIADSERDAAVAALSAVRPSARVDVGVLVETIRREAADGAEAEAERRRTDPLMAFRYQLTLLTRAQLIELRGRLAGGEDARSAMASVTRTTNRRERAEHGDRPRPGSLVPNAKEGNS